MVDDPNQAVSLVPEPQPIDQTISLFPGPRLPSSELAASRAQQAIYGLGPILGKDYDDINQAMLSGEEMSLRQEAASKIDAAAQQDKVDRMIANPAQIAQIALEPELRTNPNYVMETGWAGMFMSKMTDDTNGSSAITEAKEEIPEYVEDTKNQSIEHVAKLRKIANMLQDAQDAYGEQTLPGKAVDMLKNMIPLYSQIKTKGAIAPFGKDEEEAAMDYIRMPMSEFQARFEPEMRKLIADNPGLAITFLQRMYGMSQNEKLWQGIMNTIDVASVPGIPAVIRKVAMFNTTRRAAQDMIRASSTLQESPEVAAARGAGDAAGAATAKAAESLTKDFAGKGNPMQKAADTVTSNMKSDMVEMEKNWGNTSRELLTRLLDETQAGMARFMELIQTTARVQRIPLEKATAVQLDALKDRMKDYYSYYFKGNNQLDLQGPFQRSDTGTWYYELHNGNAKGELFAKEEHAQASAVGAGIRDFEIRPEGGKFKYVVRLPVIETDPLVRAMSLEIPDAITPHTWANAFVGLIRNPADTMARHQMLNRLAATYGPNRFTEFVRDQAQSITDLRGLFKRKRFKDFEDFLDSATAERDDEGQMGKWYKGAEDIQDWYLRNKHRKADDAEISAYFAFKRIVEFDRILRELMVDRAKMRVGAKNVQVYHFNKAGQKVSSAWVDATPLNEFPKDGASALVINAGGRHEVLKVTPSMEKRLAEGFQQGKIKVYRIYNPYLRELSEFARSQDPFRYIITDRADEREIQFTSVPRRGGGHIERIYDHYSKEPIFRWDNTAKVWHYEGDKTLRAVSLRGVGNQFADTMNEIRGLLREGKINEARDLHHQRIPDESWDDHFAAYQEKKGAEYKPAKMDVNAKVYTVPQGRLIADIDPDILKPRMGPDGVEHKVINGTRGYSDANIGTVQFTGERDAEDLQEVANIGTRNNPIFKHTAAKKIDPLPMMNRGMNRIIQSFFMDDVKMSAIEHWVTEAKQYLKDNIARDADRAPFRIFMEAGQNSFKQISPEITRQMLWNKKKIDQFIGTPSVMDNFLHSATQSLADSIYKGIGPKWALIPTKLLPYAKDPFRFIRSVVFNEKVGLFNPAQFLVHLTTYSTLLGVAGITKAIPGTHAALLHLWAVMNPRMLDTLDKMASNSIIRIPGSKSYWRPGEFKESVLMSRTTGFLRAEHEHAMIDSQMTNQVVQSGATKFLSWGQMFFKGGLTSVRTAAWHTAYREFRDQFPTKTITNTEKLHILERADLLAHNMSRAHSTIMNQGIASTMTQFYTYQQRLIEMMFPFFGTRLKTAEKIRLFATNWLLFGLPIAAALEPVPNATDWIRQEATKYGYSPGDGFFQSLGMEGGLSMLGAVISGEGDYQAGEFWNFGGRYGTKGLEWMGNALRDDKTFWDIIGGASYQTAINTLTEMDGFWRAMISGAKTVMGIPHENEVYPMTLDILMRPLREISSINAEERFREALATGNWYSKQGRILEKDVNVGEAMFMALSGLQRQSTEDIFTLSKVRKSEKEYQEQTRRLFFTAMSGYYKAMSNNDPDQAKEYFQQGQSLLITRNYPTEETFKLYHEAFRANRALANTIKWDYYTKGLPQNRKDSAVQGRQNWQQIQEKKGKTTLW